MGSDCPYEFSRHDTSSLHNVVNPNVGKRRIVTFDRHPPSHSPRHRTLRDMNSTTQHFTECWHRDGPRVLAYARRHIGDPMAQDVVGDTFLIAWRRWQDVPDPPIGWLIGTARQVIRNHVRSQRRRIVLANRMAQLGQIASHDLATTVLQRQEALKRLADLSEDHREAILLTSWDGLTTEEAALALSIKPAAFRRRLSRARAQLTAETTGPHHVPAIEEHA